MTKMPRFSSISSWTIRGVWNSIRLVLVAKVSSSPLSFFGRGERPRGFLLRIELDDQLLLHGRGELAPLRQLQHPSGQTLMVGLEPRRDGRGQVGCVADHLLGRAPVAHLNDVPGLDLIAGDVDAAAVHEEVAVTDE